jgi:hypothetical protein
VRIVGRMIVWVALAACAYGAYLLVNTQGVQQMWGYIKGAKETPIAKEGTAEHVIKDGKAHEAARTPGQYR